MRDRVSRSRGSVRPDLLRESPRRRVGRPGRPRYEARRPRARGAAVSHRRRSLAGRPLLDLEGGDMTKARLFQLTVVGSLIVFALLAAYQLLPLGMYDGA